MVVKYINRVFVHVNVLGYEKKRDNIFLVAQQVKKREKMAQLREEIAVQKARETELNKTIHITGLSL